MDSETRPSATDNAQCVAGMSDKIAATPLDSDFIAEQERIFRNAWVPVCHESELPEAYDFRTASIGNENIIICRAQIGRAHV